MNKIDTKGLVLRIFIPTIVLSVSYFILGHFCSIPHILLFCILGTFALVPIRTLPIKDKTENNILLCSYPKFFPL